MVSVFEECDHVTVVFLAGQPAVGKSTLLAILDGDGYDVVTENFIHMKRYGYAYDSTITRTVWIDNMFRQITEMILDGKTFIVVDSSPFASYLYHMAMGFLIPLIQGMLRDMIETYKVKFEVIHLKPNLLTVIERERDRLRDSTDSELRVELKEGNFQRTKTLHTSIFTQKTYENLFGDLAKVQTLEHSKWAYEVINCLHSDRLCANCVWEECNEYLHYFE